MQKDVTWELPKSWAVVKLGDFVKSEKGKKPQHESKTETEANIFPYVDIQAFEEGVIRSWTDGIDCRLCFESDFLMVWDGSRSGLVGKGIRGALGSTLVRINFPSIVNDYAFYFLQSKYQQINTRAKGVGIPHVDPALLWNYDFPIAPLPEQHRIVAKIETLFSELDKGIESFKTAREQLKIYRQALLKHAFSGKLTEQWRAENPDKLETAEALLQRIQTEREQRYQQQLKDWKDKSPSIPLLQRGKSVSVNATIQHDTIPPFEKGGVGGIPKPKAPKSLPPLTAEELAELPELPEGWAWVTTEQIADKVTDGEHITPNRTANGYLLLSARNIQNGFLDLSNVDYVPLDEYVRIRKRCNPEEGDILISCSGSIGRICRVPSDIEFVMVRSVALIKLQILKKSSKFYEYLFQSPLLQKQIEKGKKATAQANLFLSPICNLRVILCSEKEQAQILSELESRLSVVDQLDQTIATALQQAETLRQSILKKAFSGQLVPQDPNDERAGVLLERIQAEKAALMPPNKKRSQ